MLQYSLSPVSKLLKGLSSSLMLSTVRLNSSTNATVKFVSSINATVRFVSSIFIINAIVRFVSSINAKYYKVNLQY